MILETGQNNEGIKEIRKEKSETWTKCECEDRHYYRQNSLKTLLSNRGFYCYGSGIFIVTFRVRKQLQPLLYGLEFHGKL